MLLRLPGVYRPQHDTQLLAGVLAAEPLGPHSRVLDLCAGTGALSVAAAAAGAGRVTAVDVSRRAAISIRLNALARGHRIRVIHGDLTEHVRDDRFDLVVSNPPYVPAPVDTVPDRGPARAWDAGKNGRALLDRICLQAPDLLVDGGVLLLAQSGLSGVEKTLTMLEEQNMTVDVAATAEIPFGPVLVERREMLERRGLIEAGQTVEEIVVIRAVK
ncbi:MULTISPECIES: HemK2/MTQ2 family protein methyltransferase [unclassified Rhodococcus (in: high G+C Gram-positive bacteria)]|uniref:HemK2/MTQ2 family protein methyltransferase n=1 Tax=unclassified Rhodococcus (in: high G+C Gram-positive bacteria) TaxID=192944 RepID=UPI000B3D4CE9|nr:MULTISPECIES: HemK2/MTQ2 family protein methyltransferase [unclassified Rhodococcus (in: high G+C Gram-positive bacteria)]KAF0961161.1 Release factor glutamine methyltransferase [Rhodococcus sp. T7]OUS94904.1 methyltransferase [Rhodococcus sp. NCIMB 12038]